MTIEITEIDPIAKVVSVTLQQRGPTGEPGPSTPSTDAGNALQLGTDNLLYLGASNLAGTAPSTDAGNALQLGTDNLLYLGPDAYDPAGTASSAVSAHDTDARHFSGTQADDLVAAKAHANETGNPHGSTPADIGAATVSDLHDPVTVADGVTVSLTLTNQALTAEIIPGAVDATALLNGPEPGATADQTGAEIESLLDAEIAHTDWRKPVGTTAGTVAAGDDPRLSDARTPTAHDQVWTTITDTPTTVGGYGITDAEAVGAAAAVQGNLDTHTGTSSIHAPIPAVISDGDIDAGTSTTQGTITAAGLKRAAEAHGQIDIPVATTAICVAKSGSDANDGLNTLKPKLTISAALTAAAALSPSASKLVVVEVLDAGIYTESLTMASYVHLHAPAAKLIGSITHAIESAVVLKEHTMNGTYGCLLNTATAATSYYTADRVSVTSGYGFANINFGALIVTVKTATVSAGTYLTQVADGQNGHMHYAGEDVYLNGAATGFWLLASGASSQIRVAHILQIGATTGGTAFLLTAGSVVVDAQSISTTTAWNVSGGSLDITAQDVTGTKTVTGAGDVRERWHEISNGDIDAGTSTTQGTITAAGLKRAAEAHGQQEPIPVGTALTDLTGLTLNQTLRTYTFNGSADSLTVTTHAAGSWAIIRCTGTSQTVTSSGVTWRDGSDVNDIASGVELLLRSDGTTVFVSASVPTA